MKIPIKKHTKIRRPMSRYKVLLNIGSPVLFRNDIDILVSDVYTKLENPIRCISIADQIIETMNNAINESEDRAWLGLPPKNAEMLRHYPKPSLLTRVKERFKR